MNPDFVRALLAETIPFRDDLHRNIPTIRESQDLFDDLTETPSDREAAIRVVEGTRPYIVSGEGAIHGPFDYGVVDYPFETNNWSQTRFSDGSFGVFYGSLELDTTIYETVYHWLDFLSASEDFLKQVSVTDRRVYLVQADAILYECTEKYVDFPDLVHPRDYTFTNQVGNYIHETDRDGLTTKSARHDGINAPIFRKDRLSHSRPLCYLTYTSNPLEETVRVERTPSQPYLAIDWQYFAF